MASVFPVVRTLEDLEHDPIFVPEFGAPPVERSRFEGETSIVRAREQPFLASGKQQDLRNGTLTAHREIDRPEGWRATLEEGVAHQALTNQDGSTATKTHDTILHSLRNVPHMPVSISGSLHCLVAELGSRANPGHPDASALSAACDSPLCGSFHSCQYFAFITWHANVWQHSPLTDQRRFESMGCLWRTVFLKGGAPIVTTALLCSATALTSDSAEHPQMRNLDILVQIR